MGLFHTSRTDKIKKQILHCQKLSKPLGVAKSNDITQILLNIERGFPKIENKVGTDEAKKIQNTLDLIEENLKIQDLNVALFNAKELEGEVNDLIRKLTHLD